MQISTSPAEFASRYNVGMEAKRSNKRVFLIGAGVSASCGLAVARTLLKECLCELARSDSSKLRKVHKLLAYLYPSFDSDLRNYPNIEDFLNLLQMAKTFNTEDFIESSLWPIAKLQEVHDVTLKAVTDYLWSKMSGGVSSAAIECFARDHLRLTDTVITFNWDITLENALTKRYGDFEIVHTSSRKKRLSKHILILKPHGSIDWYRRSELSPAVLEVCGRLDSKYVNFTETNFSNYPDMGALQPLIVPPLASKEFKPDILKRTWRGVYRTISNATELVVIGYSLPKEDQFARLVLKRALRSNMLKHQRGIKGKLLIQVINPDESVAVTFTQTVSPAVTVRYAQATFEDYVNWLEAE